jgi:hypothetical protein
MTRSAVSDSGTTAFEVRLHRVAVDFILPSGLDVNMAVILAEDMVAAGVGEAATVAVATLVRGSLASDADQAVREMLAEHGIDVPQPHGGWDEYEVSCEVSAIGTCRSTTSRVRSTCRSRRGTTKGRWTGHW